MDYSYINVLINKLEEMLSKSKDTPAYPKLVTIINNIKFMKNAKVSEERIYDYIAIAIESLKTDGPVPPMPGISTPGIDPTTIPSGQDDPDHEQDKPQSGKDGKKRNKDNPYGFGDEIVDEDQLISEYVDADIPVFIHGASGCGKSGRVKQIDPNCTIVYLASAKPETLSGRSIVVDGEVKDIPPEWYVKLCKKCEKEPDKTHILFFDEITNAAPSVQGLAFNIILDKEVNGKWKLPSNCRIIAAGNDLEESLSANPVADPLFRRFAHVYIKTNVEKWVVWASENNIHPAIIAFIVSKGLKDNPVIRTKCNGKDPCADQRKWEMASKLLYKTNNPRQLVGIVGEDITNQFIVFVKKQAFTLEQILDGDYDHSDRKLSSDDGWSAINAIVGVDMANVEKVVEFIHLKLIPEHYSLFKNIWTAAGKNKDRVNKLKEIEMKRKLNGSTSYSYRTINEFGGYGTIYENDGTSNPEEDEEEMRMAA